MLERLATCKDSWIDWKDDRSRTTKFVSDLKSRLKSDDGGQSYKPVAPLTLLGLPVLEAALHRMPVWCRDIPAFKALEGSGSFLLDDLAKLPEAVGWLEAQSPFRQQRRCRRLFDPTILYSKYYEPLLNTLVPEKKI